MGKITIEDIAAIAKVSTATVSRVLNNKGYVNPITREKVLNIIKAEDYVPKYTAQKLASVDQRSNIIGAVFASTKEHFFKDELFYTLLQGIGDVVDERANNLLIAHVREGEYNSLPPLITNRMVDGIIIGGIPLEHNLIKKYTKLGLPVVVIGNYPGINVSKIIVDNVLGGFQATDHLIQLGHKNIGVISGDQSVYSFRDKVAGYEQALQKHGYAFNKKFVIDNCNYKTSEESGYFSARQLLENNKNISALFIADSYMRIGVMAYLNEKRIKVPNDISIVTYTTTQQMSFETKKFTCISIDELNIGLVAADHLFNIINGSVRKPVNITLSTQLNIGESTKNIKEVHD